MRRAGVLAALLALAAPAVAAAQEVSARAVLSPAVATIGEVTTYPVLTTLRATTSSFSDLAAYQGPTQYSLGTGPDAQSVAVQLLDDHLRHCVSSAVQSEDRAESERIITEASRAIERLVRS